MSLGIIGGLGPMATAYFMQRVIEMTDANVDQEHLQMIIYNYPNIPDRTSYILDNSLDNPVPYIVDLAKKLKSQGVSCVAMPCVTAHYFKEIIERDSEVSIVDVIYDTVKTIRDKGIKRIGLMATDGTVNSHVFQNEVQSQGLEIVLPEQFYQNIVMDLIYSDVKMGNKPNMINFENVKKHLFDNGAEVVVLGCTELSVIKRDYDLGAGIIDCLDVLAKQSIIRCNKRVKEKYEELFVPLKS